MLKKEVKFIFCIFTIIIISNVQIVLSEEIQLNKKIIDQQIQEKLNSNEKIIDVFFKLDDISKADNLISNLSDEEFQFIGKSPSRIVGKITKEGLDKLINDGRVKEIYYNFPVEATNNKTKDENKIYSEKERDYQLYMWIILGGLLLIIFYIIIRKNKNNR